MNQVGSISVFWAAVLLALLLGGFGLIFQALRWLLILALAVFIVGSLLDRRR
jgi:hypothetical protein